MPKWLLLWICIGLIGYHYGWYWGLGFGVLQVLIACVYATWIFDEH